ncbi:uncharacterized protein LOC121812643 [Haplochromis burtoni]|uniref:uncharacterized protein LOC121812643 n=1 Tax=Haplochromis burtoni TaxID=8153 RepID=UPI001C2DABAC|nr:uncharacterized protein LOC121812643 [Haplochromis burtoni]
MEEELQQLRDLVAQLRADNEQLRRDGGAVLESGGGAASSSSVPAGCIPNVGSQAAVTERLVVVPRDRKCPMFNGRTGINIAEWVEEVQACMRARHLSVADQAFFIFDHLEGEAREEIKFRPNLERGDPARVLTILKELYGNAQSYVTLQQAFFSRRQREGETLQEFSLALMALMEQVKQSAPDGMRNAEVLLRDQFVEHVVDSGLRRELKQYVRRVPTATLLEVRGEAIRWEREGFSGGVRDRGYSQPSAYGFQCGVHTSPRFAPVGTPESEWRELKELLSQQGVRNQPLSQVSSVYRTPETVF